VHDAVGRLEVLPNKPTGHAVQTHAPDKEYDPGWQAAAVGDVDPAAQMEPALQLPEHAAVGSPATPPYSPAEQLVHTVAPPRENVPAGQMDAVALVDPAGQV
jgi:hypothetical protein